jgi:hypothetical protein
MPDHVPRGRRRSRAPAHTRLHPDHVRGRRRGAWPHTLLGSTIVSAPVTEPSLQPAHRSFSADLARPAHSHPPPPRSRRCVLGCHTTISNAGCRPPASRCGSSLLIVSARRERGRRGQTQPPLRAEPATGAHHGPGGGWVRGTCTGGRPPADQEPRVRVASPRRSGTRDSWPPRRAGWPRPATFTFGPRSQPSHSPGPLEIEQLERRAIGLHLLEG